MSILIGLALLAIIAGTMAGLLIVLRDRSDSHDTSWMRDDG